MIVDLPSRSLLLKVRQPERVLSVIPKAKLFNYQGHNVAVRFELDEVRVLNNLGIAAPSPIMYDYKWPGRFKNILAHQKVTASQLTIHKRMFVLNQTGTMKTASALWAADYLMRQGSVRKVLICAKLSTLQCVWMEEIFSVLMHRSAVVLHGTRARRLERLAHDVDFYIINHEGLELVENEIRRRKDIDLIIYDEASELRNAGNDKYGALRRLLYTSQGQSHHRFWPLTATPCPNAPTDAWALARLVDPSRVPSHFNAFQRMTMLKVSDYRWVPKAGATEIAYNAMQPAVRFLKKDCLDLPPLVIQERTAELSKEQKRAYAMMRQHLIMEASTGGVVTAVNAADKINKLRQILLGAVKNDESYTVIDFKPRLDVLLDCIRDASAKVLVIVPFKGIIRALEPEVAKHFSCMVLNGDVSPNKRNEIIQQFKSQPDPRVLLCHPKIMAHGLNLTEADTCVFYGPIYSNDEFAQVVERINRPGQTRKMTVIRMGAQDVALEWSIYKMLDSRAAEQENILDLYRNTLGDKK